MKKVGEIYDITNAELEDKILELLNSPKPVQLTTPDFDINSIVSVESISIVEDNDEKSDTSYGYSIVAYDVVTEGNKEHDIVQLAYGSEFYNFLGKVLDTTILSVTFEEEYLTIFTRL